MKNYINPVSYKSPDDPRLQENKAALTFFTAWENQVNQLDIDPTEKAACLMPWQTRRDLQSMVLGFDQYIVNKHKHGRQLPVDVNNTNNDVVENIFCSQRGMCGGNTTNPTCLQYRNNLNAIILSQSLYNPSANASNNYTAAKPFSASF